MANVCSFSMALKGDSQGIQAFINAMEQQNGVYMGRGAEIHEVMFGDGRVVLSGSCKWSVVSAMHSNAVSMREEPQMWSFTRGVPEELLTFEEACKKYAVSMEVYSSESGIGFQEHYLCNTDGERIVDECVDYSEEYLGDYASKEEAAKELEMEISDEDWEREWVEIGGFPEWNFSI